MRRLSGAIRPRHISHFLFSEVAIHTIIQIFETTLRSIFEDEKLEFLNATKVYRINFTNKGKKCETLTPVY